MDTFLVFKFLQKKKTTVKLVRSVLGVSIFHHFPKKNLDRTITFNSLTLKNTQTEPQKYIIFSTKQIIFRVSGWNIKIILDFFFYLLENYSRRVRKSTNKKFSH